MKLIEYQSPVNGTHSESLDGKTEEQLFIEIKNIKNRFENSKLLIYHAIGTKIKGYYGKDYGNNEMAKISKAIDLPISTVYKIFKFAEKYDQKDVEEISDGAFQLSWHRLRDNLSLQKEEVLRAYRASHHIMEFSKKIKQIKSISKSRQEQGKGKCESSEEGGKFCPKVLNFPPQDSDVNLSNLQTEITRLRSELDYKIDETETLHRMIAIWKTEWISKFPLILRELDEETLKRLESSLVEEKKRRARDCDEEQTIALSV